MFRVGDTVEAIQDNYYTQTTANNRWVGIVTRVNCTGSFDANTVSTRSRLRSMRLRQYKSLRPQYFRVKELAQMIDYEETLGFHELEDDKEYRLLHGGEKDHGYIYELRDGRLFNKIKRRFSVVPFNNKVRFVESVTKKFNLSTLEFDIILGPQQAKIGCQNVSKEDLLEFSRIVQEFYGV